MKKDSFERVLHFLIGASWAFIILGALLTFKFFLLFGLTVACLSVFVFIFFSLFFVLLLDFFLMQKIKYHLLEKQIKLLEQLLQRQNKEEMID